MIKIKGIIVDFDGTLIDTMEHFKKVAGIIINKYYKIPIEEAERLYIETSGVAFVRQMEIIKPGGDMNSIVVKEFEELKLKGIENEKIDDDSIFTLNKLKDRGIKLGISSGNFEDVIIRFLEKENFIFDVVMGHREGFEKGSAHFQYFLEKTGLSKNDIIFIGDSIKDGERAYSFGIKFIAKEGIFSSDRFKKEFGENQIVIKKLSEVLNFV
ncbi:MAG TPA: HAD-IA family hydrolase [Spirochaetota bacterium]|mgnify:CR=1 FL=1|nr:HAD-IA family hydrolase [Spirochaetota bacterium]HOM37801.1 HAD-IA family hydrolase [Spirochaetota bacterium]HPQ49322.1 HAD-IA family hydrolase [Spirochaetota bacterium]